MSLNFHEDLERAESIRGSSDRTFGLVFAAAALLFGLAPLRHHNHVRLWSVGLAALFLGVALLRPSLLHTFNRWWTRLGLLMGRVVNPIVMAILFFVVFTPVGFLLRLLGKDPLRLKPDAAAESYWIPRTPQRPLPESMPRQF